MPLAPPENRVHDFAFPNQLQRLKTLHLLVRRIATLPFQGLVVIHHHRVQRQCHQHGLAQLQPPNKQFLQHPAERTRSEDRKRAEKPLYRVRRRHLLVMHPHDWGVAGILLQFVEVAHVPARSIEEEIQHLQK